MPIRCGKWLLILPLLRRQGRAAPTHAAWVTGLRWLPRSSNYVACREIPEDMTSTEKLRSDSKMVMPIISDHAEAAENVTDEANRATGTCACQTYVMSCTCDEVQRRFSSDKCGLMQKEIKGGSCCEVPKNCPSSKARKKAQVASRTRQAGKCILRLQLVKL